MQLKRVAQLRREWARKGNPPCDHPHLDKEYDLGGDTSDLVCTTCGESWWRNDPDRPKRAPYDRVDE